MRVLITGITGFVGSHLAEYVLREFPGVEVYGSIRWRSRTENIEHLRDKVRLIESDLKDPVSVSTMISQVKPDRLFHLAAESFVPTSWKAPSQTFTVNCIGQINIMEALKNESPHTRMQIAGSSEEYGLVHPNEVPIRETNPLRPLSPYAVSKIAQDMLAYQYHMSYNLHIVRTRAFNHTGPRRGEVFVESNFAKQIAMIEKGLQEPIIRVGNLTSRRDFTDVRDIVRGYWLSLEKAEAGEVYNLAHGDSITIQELLDRLLAMSTVKPTVLPDPSRMRPSDVEILEGSHEKFTAATGWKPEIPLEKTLRDLLEYWRERVHDPRTVTV